MLASFATLPRKNGRKERKNLEAQQCLLATALYDNKAEAADELAFCKGDILTVLEQNPNGLVGWWLCSLRGKCGICPGNRLRMLGHVVCNALQTTSTVSPTQTRHVRQASDPLRTFTNITSPLSVHHQNPAGNSPAIPSMKDRPADNPNKVVIPHKVGDVYLYDVPDCRIQTPSPTPKKLDGCHASSLGAQPAMPTYDTPRPHRFIATAAAAASSHRQQTPSPAAKMMYDVPKGADESYDIPRSHPTSQRHSTGELPSMLDYDIPRHHGGSKVESLCYDVPPSMGLASSTGSATDMTYDIPPATSCRVGDFNGSNRSSCASMSSSSSGPSPVLSGNSLTPSLSLSSLGGNSSSNRSSLEQPHELYDIPRPTAASNQDAYDMPTPTSEVMPSKIAVAAENVYDVPPQVTRDCGNSEAITDSSAKRLSDPVPGATTPAIQGRELPLELDAAMDMLVKLQQNVQAATQKLFSIASIFAAKRKAAPNSRSYDLQTVCGSVRNATQDFLDFANGALVNSSKGSDIAVCQRLNKLLHPLTDANAIVHSTCKTMETNSWAMMAGDNVPTEFDRLVYCARTLTEDVRQVACFIQGNSTLIFKRAKPISISNSKTQLADSGGQATSPVAQSGTLLRRSSSPPVSLPPKTRDRPLPTLPSGLKDGGKSRETEKSELMKPDENLYENDSTDWVEDYDYVNLESKEIFQKKNEEYKARLPEELRKSFDNVLKESLVQVDDSVKGKIIPEGLSILESTKQDVRLDANDRQVVCFYSKQLDTHSVYLNNAIQAFLLTVERNQPPKIFVDYGKFVILGAHKLVYIGDTVHRNVSHPEVRHQVQRCADELCEALKMTVQRIKTAALQFPSVLAVQEMVDSVVDVSHTASYLKNVIAQFAN